MQNIQDMNRPEVITELARWAHPSWYHSLLEWETPQLKALLTYYREGGQFPTQMVGKIHRTKGLGDDAKEQQALSFVTDFMAFVRANPKLLDRHDPAAAIGIDWSNGPDRGVATFYEHGKAPRVVIIRPRRFGLATQIALSKIFKQHKN